MSSEYLNQLTVVVRGTYSPENASVSVRAFIFILINALLLLQFRIPPPTCIRHLASISSMIIFDAPFRFYFSCNRRLIRYFSESTFHSPERSTGRSEGRPWATLPPFVNFFKTKVRSREERVFCTKWPNTYQILHLVNNMFILFIVTAPFFLFLDPPVEGGGM